MNQKYIKIDKKSDCTGCRACEQICPVKAIQMKEDDEGFLFPVVNKEKCINCGLCKEKCPQNKYNFKVNESITVYGIKAKNQEISRKSTSGGVSHLIAKQIIKQNGVVFGSAYDADLNVKHICIEKENELERIRGSKYVISDTQDAFTKVKKYLETGKKVLFTGCPCQIAGLKNFLNKDYENLFLIDIVCHGVPSQKIFKKYLKWKEKKINRKITNYVFRSKEKVGWGLGFSALIETDKGKIYQNADFDGYYTAFLKGKLFRECCYECKYANMNRLGDITLADFWGIEKFDKKMYTKAGVSLAIVNTEKGKRMIQLIDKDIILNEYSQVQATRFNSNLVKPSTRPEIRNIIYKELDKMNFDDFTKKYLLSSNDKIKAILKNSVPKSIKIFYKKYIK